MHPTPALAQGADIGACTVEELFAAAGLSLTGEDIPPKARAAHLNRHQRREARATVARLREHDRIAALRGWTTADGWTTTWRTVPEAAPGDVVETDSEGRPVILRSVPTYGPRNLMGNRRRDLELAERLETRAREVLADVAAEPDAYAYPERAREGAERDLRDAARLRERFAWGEERAALVSALAPRSRPPAPPAPVVHRPLARARSRAPRRQRRTATRLAAQASAGSGAEPPQGEPPAPSPRREQAAARLDGAS
jgi:hypothetical protein